MPEPFCRDVQDVESRTIYPDDRVGVVMVVLGCLYLMSSFLIIYFIRVQERNAQQGNDFASKSVIFPAYVNILWVNAGVNVYAGLVAWAYNFQPIDAKRSLSALAFAFMWGIQHIVNEGVALLLMQKGLGINAAKQSLRFASLWGLVTFFMQYGMYVAESQLSFILSLAWNAILWLFYVVLWLTPRKRLYRRPAALFYAKFWSIFRLMPISSSVLYYTHGTYDVGNCMFVFGALYSYVLFQPFILYYTLLLDSRWWQGCEYSDPKKFTNDIRSPLQGVDLDLKAAQSLAASMDNIGIRTFRAGKKPVRLLNFAYISLDSQIMLGCGSFSKVYKGKYRDRICAIKLVFTLDLTESVIRRISAEAQILSKIRHPNVVDIVGVSVLPPSVCILLELCPYGSLWDVIAGTGPNQLDYGLPQTYMRGFMQGGSFIGSRSSRGLGISWTDRLHLAMGCARGLHALHGFSAGLCHRDVKSFNFLVDAQLNAKISDLELGIADDDPTAMRRRKALALIDSRARRTPVEGRGQTSQSSSQSTSDLEALVDDIHNFTADDFLANWAAPEVIRDGLHSQASDVYSFGLVLWELLAGVVPFGEVKRQDEIRQKVLSGERPTVPKIFTDCGDERINEFLQLLERCWAPDPQQRPKIGQVVAHIESMYKQRCHEILWTTEALKDIDLSKVQTRGFSMWTARVSSQPLTRDQLSQIWTQLKAEKVGDDGNCLDKFEETGVAWLLLANDPALTLVWSSSAWEEDMNVDLTPLLGKPFNTLPLFEISAEEIESQPEKLFEKLKEIQPNHPKHMLMRLVSKSVDPAGPDDAAAPAPKSTPSTSLFAIHAFPIISKSARLSSEIPIPEPEPELSTLRRLSNSFKSFSAGTNTGSSGGFRNSFSSSQSPVEMLPQSSILFRGNSTSGPLLSASFQDGNAFPVEQRGSVSMIMTPSAGSVEAMERISEVAEEQLGEDISAYQVESPQPARTSILSRRSAEVVMIALSFTKLK